MKYTLAIVLSIIVLTIGAQNLVVNPGFEEYKKGPLVTYNSFATYQVKGWNLFTAGTPDWFCNSPAIRSDKQHDHLVPTDIGDVDPHSGNSYAGFIGFSRDPQGNEYSEYPRGALNTKLISGRVYIVSFWIAQAFKSDLKIDSVGVCLFADNFIMDTNTCQVKTKAQVKIAIDTSKKWTLVQGEFIADGTEQFFVIGNFVVNFPRSGKYYTKPNAGWHNAYYFIDDISIVEKPEALSIVAGQKLTFNNILFETGNSTLTTSSYAQLDQIVAAMKKQSTLKVQISGHTDSDGDAKANQTLSEQRAVSVKNYFISKGIDSARISTKGFGSSQPIGSDKSKNRRVEFVFSQ